MNIDTRLEAMGPYGVPTSNSKLKTRRMMIDAEVHQRHSNVGQSNI